MYLTYDIRSKDIKIYSQIKLAIITNLDILIFHFHKYSAS